MKKPYFLASAALPGRFHPSKRRKRQSPSPLRFRTRKKEGRPLSHLHPLLTHKNQKWTLLPCPKNHPFILVGFIGESAFFFPPHRRVRGFEKRGSSKREETQCENARSSVSPLNGKKAKNLAFSSPPYISKKERKRREGFFRGKTTPTFFCGEGKRGNSICLGKGPLLLFFFLLFYFWKVLAGFVVWRGCLSYQKDRDKVFCLFPQAFSETKRSPLSSFPKYCIPICEIQE